MCVCMETGMVWASTEVGKRLHRCEMDAFPNRCGSPFDGFVGVQKALMENVNGGINVFQSKTVNSTQPCRPTDALSSTQGTILH